MELPAELRVMIYKFTFPGPRHIDIGPTRTENTTPIALHINKESRYEAKKVYRLIYQQCTSNNGETPVTYRSLLCFDPARDTVYTDASMNKPFRADNPTGPWVHENDYAEWMTSAAGDLSAITNLEVRGVRFVELFAIEHYFFDLERYEMSSFAARTKWFPGLKKLKVTLECGRGSRLGREEVELRYIWFKGGDWRIIKHAFAWGFEEHESREEAMRTAFQLQFEKFEEGKAPEIEMPVEDDEGPEVEMPVGIYLI